MTPALSLPRCTLLDTKWEAVLHSQDEVEDVLRFVAEGWNDCQISRATGIYRTTVREWRRNGPPGRLRTGSAGCPRCDDRFLQQQPYAYLLGLYPGDGYIARHPRVYKLRISLDARYPGIIAECRLAIARVRDFDVERVRLASQVGCFDVYAYWKHWPCLFPQHGTGPKHRRPIVLRPWQVAIVRNHPRELLRGLIHSDGCRVINRVSSGKYEYPRYFFTNSSDDILQIFRDACDTKGVRHRNSKPNVISVARRQSVAILDTFIGPKG